MPFTIEVKINRRPIIQIEAYNDGNPAGDLTQPERLYNYSAKHADYDEPIKGTLTHIRNEGIEKLSSMILTDIGRKAKTLLPNKTSGFKNEHALLIEILRATEGNSQKS